MPKKIVLLLDGTSNEIKTDRSNILRLYGTLKKSPEQLVYYDPGVGTFGAETAWSKAARKGAEVWGMATGWGLDTNVLEAYDFLVNNYDIDANGLHDSIHIFGFSRGAYTARVLAGFLHAFGIVENRNSNLVNYAYRAYKAIGEKEGKADFSELRLHERILRPHRPSIRQLALFDTVASVIESGRILPRLRHHAFTANNPSVQSVRHALAIHERRSMFRAQLWPGGQTYYPNRFNEKSSKKQDLREVWFAGVHGDIGGGYPEKESALAKYPLYWMVKETEALGLEYKTRTVNELVLGKNPEKDYVSPDINGKLHDSLKGPWNLVELVPRRRPEGSKRISMGGWTIPLGDWRAIPEDALLHRSAVDRFDLKNKRPPNIPRNHGIAEEQMPRD
ncbi:MAG: DUF2235 domain-containing protein [Pseudomonadota bacterium]